MALHSRTSARSRRKKNACTSYRKVLWFRPRLEILEDRTLLSGVQPSDVLAPFNNAASALAGQTTSIVNQALNLTLPLMNSTDKLGSDLVGLANNIQAPFNTNNLAPNNWQSQLTNAGFKVDEAPVVNSDGTWNANSDGNFLEVTWKQTFSIPVALVAGSTGFSYLDSTGGLFGAVSATASVTFTVTMGVDNSGTGGTPDFFVLASNAGNSTVPGTALTATVTAGSTNALSGTLNLPGSLGNVSAQAGPTLNITADGKLQTTSNDTPADQQAGKMRLSDFTNSQNLQSAISASFDPSSSAQLNATFSASLLGTNVQWKATGSYNLNSNDTGWDHGSFNVDSSGVDPASLLKSIGSQFFSLGDGIPILGPLTSALNQPLPLINQSIGQLTGLDKDLPQLPSLPGNFTDGTYQISLAGGTLSVNVTPAAIKALLDPPSGQTVNLISWTTGKQSVSLVDSSIDVPIFALGIPGIADVELDAHFGVDASLNYDLGFGLDNHGFYFQAGDPSDPAVGLSFSVDAGVTGAVKVFGFPLASATGDVGFAITPYVTLTAPPKNTGWDNGYYDPHKVYLSDLETAFGANPLSDLVDDISAGIQGDLTGTLTVSINLLLTSLSKSFGLSYPVFNYQTSPTWPPPPPPPGPLGTAAPGDSTKWQQVVQINNGVLTFDDTLSSNKGDTISLSEDPNNPGAITIAWAGGGSQTYTGITQFRFIAAHTSGNNHLLVTPGFNIPIYADDSASSGGDLLESGSGNDTLIGGSGNDTFIAGSGNDSITSGNGNDVIVGGKGSDTIVAGNGNDTITGGAGNSTISAGTGADSIFTGSGNDIVSILGGSSNDTLVAGNGNDLLDAGTGTGNDLIVGGSGHDTLRANAGNDTIRGGSGDSILDCTTNGGSGNDSISAGSGNDTIYASSGSDTIDGGSGSDTIYGGNGANDQIHGGAAGNNLIYGGAGGHNLIYGGGPGDTIYGGAGGYDTIHGGTASDPNSNTNNQIYGGAGGHNLIFASGGGDVVYAGTGGNSTIYGGTGAETLYGGDGQDLVVNAQGNGLVNAGGDDRNTTGNDLLIAGSGNDVLYGDSQAGHNTLQAGVGQDTLYAGIGGDVLEAGSGLDALYGGPGDDTLVLPYFPPGQQQPDILNGGPGANTLVITAAQGVASPGPGTLTTSLDASSTTLSVTDGAAITNAELNQPGGYVVQIDNEQMLVTAVSGNTLTVQRGYNGTTAAVHNAGALLLPVPPLPSASNYKIYLAPVAGTNNQYLATLSDLNSGTLLGENTFSMPPGTANLELDGGPGDNWIQVDPAVTQNVILYGGPGHNTLMAGSGSDTLVAGPGSGVLYGGSGDDVLYGGNLPGQDVPTGGATGTTTYKTGPGFVQAFGTVTSNNNVITGLNNTSGLSAGQFVYGVGIVPGTTIVWVSGNTIRISTPAQTSGSENLIFGGPEGHDTLIAGSGNDALFAGNGGDVLIGGSVLRQTGANGVPGLAQLSSTGDYVLTQGAGRDMLEGGAGNDLLIAGPGSPGEILTAGTGNDTLVSENNGDNVLQGGPGNDLLLGGSGNDVLISGSRASTGNTLVGGLGLDTLLGGAGSDVLYAYPEPTAWTQAEQSALADNIILTPPGSSVPGASPLEQEIAKLLQQQQSNSNGLDPSSLSNLSTDLVTEFAALGISSPLLSGDQMAKQLQPQNLANLTPTQFQTLVSALDEAPVVESELQGILTLIQDTRPQGQGLTIGQQNLLYYMLLNAANQLQVQEVALQNQIEALPPSPERTPQQQAQAYSLGNAQQQVLTELKTVDAELTGTLVDSLVGGSGQDQLYGSPYYPTDLDGGTGSDTFYNYHTDDTVLGGSAGDNTLVIEGDGVINVQPDQQNINGVTVAIGAKQNGTLTNGSTIVTGLTDTSQLGIGESVTAADIPSGTVITAINSATQITLSNPATANATELLTFAVPQIDVGNGVGNIANIQLFEVQTGNGNDKVNVDLTTLPSGLTGLKVQAGSGNDVIDASQLQNAATLLGGSGNDIIRIGTQLASNSVYNGGMGQSELDIVGPTDASQSMTVAVSNGVLTVNGVPAKLSNFDKIVMIGGAGTNIFTSDGTTVNNATGNPTTVVMEGGSGPNTFYAENGVVNIVGGSGQNNFFLLMPTGSGYLGGIYRVTGGTGFNNLGIFGDNNGDNIIISQDTNIPFADTANADPSALPVHVSAFDVEGGSSYMNANIANLGKNSGIFVQGGSGNDYLDASGMLMGVDLDGYSGNDTLIGGAGQNYLYYTGPGSTYNGGTGLRLSYDGDYGSLAEAGSTQNTLIFPGTIPSNISPPPNIEIYEGHDSNGNPYTEPVNPPGTMAASSINVQQGNGPIVNLTADFTDGSSTSSAVVSIDWGDGTTTAGNVSRQSGFVPLPFVVSNSHIYATNGAHTITVTIIDSQANYATASTTFTGGLQLVNGDLRYYNGSNSTLLATGVQSFGVRNADPNAVNGVRTPSIIPDVALFYLLNNGQLYRIDATDTSEISSSVFQTILMDPYGGLFALDKNGNSYFNYPFSGVLTLDHSNVQAILEDAIGTIYRWMADGTLWVAPPGAYNRDTKGPIWLAISPPNSSSVTAVSLSTDGSTLYVRDANGQYWAYNELSALDSIGSAWTYLGGLHLALNVPANVTAGQLVPVTVQALDYFNNPVAAGTPISVHFTDTDVLAGAPANQAFSGPSDTFNYFFDTAGSQTLSAYLINGSTISSTGSASATVTVAPGQPLILRAHIQKATPVYQAIQVSPQVASPQTSDPPPTSSQPTDPSPPPNIVPNGTPLAITVTAYDALGNVATGYNGTIQFSSSGGNTGLPGNYTFTPADGGTHTFYATLDTAGAQSVRVSDTNNSQLSSVSPSVVEVNPATQLLVTLQPPISVTAGQTFGLSVEAVDALGNLDATFNGPVTLALGNNPGGVTLGGTLTVNAVNGVATFSGLTLDKAGIYTLLVSSNGLIGTTTRAFTVAAAPATQLAVTTPPPGTVAVNHGFGLAISAEDGFGNVDTTFTGVVALTLLNNPGNATLGGTLTVNAVNGVASFSNVTLNQPGRGYTLQATSGTLTGTATGAINVAGAATQLAVTSQPPSSISINQPFTLTLSAEDALGLVDPSFNGAVTLSLQSNPGGATLGGTLTVNAVNGVATFSNLTLDQPGIGYSLQASAGGLTGTTTAAFTVFAPLPPPPPPPPPVPPPAPPNVPPLLAFLNQLLGDVETVSATGTTIVDYFFGIPLLVETYNYSGSLVSVTLFGFDITFLFV